MKIDSSTIGMESARSYACIQKKTAKFAVMDYKGNKAHDKEEEKDSSLELSDHANILRSGRSGIRESRQSTLDAFRQQVIRSIFAMLFGRDKTKELFGDSESGKYLLQNTNLGENSNQLVAKKQVYFEETEEVSFSATGLVKTADGREIAINLDMYMSRSFSQYYEEEMKIMKVNTCDPLVINFDGDTAKLSDQKFFFDLDADGQAEKISRLQKGSGYLALDKNGDGKINDGSELFGPKSGDGFADLAAYDEDGNGFIDENDTVFNKLKIWCQDENGESVLYTLKEKNVGAICLQHARTEFSLKNEENSTNGIIRSTGIFLYENGMAGTIQHLDLAQ